MTDHMFNQAIYDIGSGVGYSGLLDLGHFDGICLGCGRPLRGSSGRCYSCVVKEIDRIFKDYENSLNKSRRDLDESDKDRQGEGL